MPSPAYILPQALSPLHLYRHLLREASYLPPAFRATVDSSIRSRFNAGRKDGMLTKKRLSKARTSLRTLRAANSGDKVAMGRLILKGFGRSGKRRRELMSQLVRPQGPDNSQALETLLDEAGQRTASPHDQPQPSLARDQDTKPAGKRTSKNAFFEKWDQPKLLKIARSQKQQQQDTKGATSWPVQVGKYLEPDQFVPKTSIWGQPPAAVLITARRAHFWRRMADKIMPPLGKGEWQLLQRLGADGQVQGEWSIPRRRAHPAGKPTQTGPTQKYGRRWNWEPYATGPAEMAEKPTTLAWQRRTGQSDSSPYAGRPRSRSISDRWFRRSYKRTWQLTPVMEQDPNTLQYRLDWGRVTPKLPAPTETQMHIFEGVDAKGHKIHEISTTDK